MKPQVLTVKEVAEVFRVSPCTIYRLVKQGKLHCFKVGDYRFLTTEIEKFTNPNGVTQEKENGR